MKIEGEPIEVNVVFGYFLHGFRYAVSNLFFFFFLLWKLLDRGTFSQFGSNIY